jgi:hypothetical protein
MASANVKLSPQELELVRNREWLIMKRSVMDKAAALLADFRNSIDAHQRLSESLASYGMLSGIPKISKGENYRGFPYVVLDHPRVFERQDVFSLRCLFWWGHHFLMSFHLEGKHRDVFLQRLSSKNIQGQAEWYVCVHDDPWQHYFERDNFLPVQEKTLQEWMQLLTQKRFIKIAAKTDVSGWNETDDWFEQRLNELADWLG